MPLSIFSAVLLGILEGLTEFIPVSSTGHLILLGDILEFTGPKADTFSIFIQLGAILAVVVLYWKRFMGLLSFSNSKEEGPSGFVGWSGIKMLLAGCVPVMLAGFFAHSYIKARLFAPLPVALALGVGGLLMILIDRPNRRAGIHSVDELSLKNCLMIGLFQCFALWPGMSRSGSTIIGGLLCGLDRRLAAEFSFLLAVPVMCVAVAYDLLKSASILSMDDIPVFAVGFIVSFVVAILAIRFFLALLAKMTMALFGYYRIILAVLVYFFMPS